MQAISLPDLCTYVASILPAAINETGQAGKNENTKSLAWHDGQIRLGPETVQ